MQRPCGGKEFPMFKEKEMSVWLERTKGKVALCEMSEEGGQGPEFPGFLRPG